MVRGRKGLATHRKCGSCSGRFREPGTPRPAESHAPRTTTASSVSCKPFLTPHRGLGQSSQRTTGPHPFPQGKVRNHMIYKLCIPDAVVRVTSRFERHPRLYCFAVYQRAIQIDSERPFGGSRVLWGQQRWKGTRYVCREKPLQVLWLDHHVRWADVIAYKPLVAPAPATAC